MKKTISYISWAREVKEKAHSICKRCWKYTEHGTSHHKASKGTRPDLRLDVSNGIYLCFTCHRWVHDHPRLAKQDGFISNEKYELVHKI